jgi:uncharacterized Zn-binding protein involved in type VI secretion
MRDTGHCVDGDKAVKPAARVGDMHFCPVLLPKFHLGGPIVDPAATTVLVGDQQAARLSDLAQCMLDEHNDLLNEGAATVLIEGLNAVRKCDGTAHGGEVVQGLETVLIGGESLKTRKVELFYDPITGTWCMRYGTSIVIRPGVWAMNNPAGANYQTQTLQALVRLDSTPTMHSAIDAIERTGRTVTIEQYWGQGGPFNALTTPLSIADGINAGVSINGEIGTGRGSDSIITWSPHIHTLGDAPGHASDAFAPGSDIILGHELIHATHLAQGNAGHSLVPNLVVAEERNTTGLPEQTYGFDLDSLSLHGTVLPSTEDQMFTENRLRADYRARGIRSPITGRPPQQRPFYTSGGTPY